MSKMDRRKFIGKTIAATGAVAAGKMALTNGQNDSQNAGATELKTESKIERKKPAKPTDKVMLGKSGIAVSLVGMGTGSIGGKQESNQTRLGQEMFTRLTRHAFDNGITFFDLADQYGSHPYFAKAIKGIPREQYVIQTKVINRDTAKAKDDIDRFLRELETDYIDSLIIHVVKEADWTTKYRGIMDAFEEARQAGKIRAHGVTCHSFKALQAAHESDWVQINQVRWNARRSHMDADVETVRDLFAKMRAKGQGMIGMKVVGQGDILKGEKPLTPEECYRFQIESGVVDAFVVGLEKLEHVDQLLNGTQRALDEAGYRFA